jgi:hypothetical protein
VRSGANNSQSDTKCNKEAVFVGYEPHSKGYTLWDSRSRSIVSSQDVTFDKKTFPSRPAVGTQAPSIPNSSLSIPNSNDTLGIPSFLMPHLAHRPRRHQHLLESCLRPLRIRGEHWVHRHLRVILMMTLSRTHHPNLLLPLPLHTSKMFADGNNTTLIISTLFPHQFFLLHLWRGILTGTVLLSCRLCLVHLGI